MGSSSSAFPFPTAAAKPTLPRMGNNRAAVSDAVANARAAGNWVARHREVPSSPKKLSWRQPLCSFERPKHAGESSSGSQVRHRCVRAASCRRAHGRAASPLLLSTERVGEQATTSSERVKREAMLPPCPGEGPRQPFSSRLQDRS